MKLNAKNLGMPERYWDASLSNLNIPTEFHAPLNEWLKNPKLMLILSGPPGTGKTYICAAILNILWHNKEVRYFRDSDLYMHAKEAIKRGWDGCKQMISLCDCKYLIIDDLGVDEVTSYNLVCWENLINYRYNKNKSFFTVITTNLLPTQIKEKYSERFYSRMFDKENELIVLHGYNLRIPE